MPENMERETKECPHCGAGTGGRHRRDCPNRRWIMNQPASGLEMLRRAAVRADACSALNRLRHRLTGRTDDDAEKEVYAGDLAVLRAACRLRRKREPDGAEMPEFVRHVAELIADVMPEPAAPELIATDDRAGTTKARFSIICPRLFQTNFYGLHICARTLRQGKTDRFRKIFKLLRTTFRSVLLRVEKLKMAMILKVKEVMKILGITKSRYYELIKDRTLPYCLKKGGKHKFHLESHITICKRNLEAKTVIVRQPISNERSKGARNKFGKRLTGLEKTRAALRGELFL